jgi:hypothetical protein
LLNSQSGNYECPLKALYFQEALGAKRKNGHCEFYFRSIGYLSDGV